MKSRQPGGGDGERGDESGELGRDSSDVKLEASETSSMPKPCGMLKVEGFGRQERWQLRSRLHVGKSDSPRH